MGGRRGWIEWQIDGLLSPTASVHVHDVCKWGGRVGVGCIKRGEGERHKEKEGR